MTGAKNSGGHAALNIRGQLQQAKCVRDLRSRTPNALRKFFLGAAKVGEQLRVSSCFLECIQI